MIPTTLYIKCHNKTGKLYFGKTVELDPIKYPGSGVYWKKHLLEHGNNVTTIWHNLFTEENDIVEFSTFFSEFFDIVNSNSWANLIPENGIDGFPPGGKMPPRSVDHLKNWAESKKRWVPSESTRALWSNQRSGKKASDSTKLKHSYRTTGANNPNALEWDIYYPTGEIVRVKGLASFCQKNKLSFRNIYYSLNGWKSIKHGCGKGGNQKGTINAN